MVVMFVKGHQIKKKIKKSEFLDQIKLFPKEKMNCNKHTLFRLSEGQREHFNCSNLKEILCNETPILAGIQYNNRHTAFYRDKDKKILRIILNIKINEIEIITFYYITKLPVIKNGR